MDDWGDRLPKTYESDFIYHNFAKFRKQHSRYKAFCRPLFHHNRIVKYSSTHTVAKPLWDLTTKWCWNRPPPPKPYYRDPPLPPTILFPSLFMMLLKLANLWNFNQINSWFSQFTMEVQNTTQYNYSKTNVIFNVVFCLKVSEVQMVSWMNRAT